MKQEDSTMQKELLDEQQIGQRETTNISIHFSEMLDALPGCYMHIELENRWMIKFANKAMLDLLGFPSLSDFLKLTGGFLENLVHMEDFYEIEVHMRKLLSKQTDEDEMHGECRLKNSDHNWAWVHFSAKRSPQHGNNSLVCLFHDTSQERRANAQLALSMDELNATKSEMEFILGQTPGGIHVCQLFDHIHVVFLSDSLCALTGYSRTEVETLFKNDYSQMIHPKDRHIFHEAMTELSEYPHELTVGYRLVKKSGEAISVSDSIKSIRDSNGNMWAYAVISEQDADAESWERVSRFSECIAYPVVGFTIVDGKATLDIFNDAFCSLVGKSRERVAALGKVDPAFSMDERERAHIQQKVDLITSGQDFVEIDLRVPAWNKGVEYNATATVFFRQGGIIRVISVIETDKLRSLTEKEIFQVSRTGSQPTKIEVRTFGYFDVFVDGQPVVFHSGKAKELLAYLVDRRGAFASASEIIAALWENEPANKVTRSRCRKTVMRLLDELRNYGIDNIVETADNGSRRIIPELVTCDYYEYLSGKPEYQNLFHGAYMSNYS